MVKKESLRCSYIDEGQHNPHAGEEQPTVPTEGELERRWQGWWLWSKRKKFALHIKQ